MDSEAFILKSFMDSRKMIARVNTESGTIEFFKHDNDRIPLNREFKLQQYLDEYMNLVEIHSDDKKYFDVLRDFNQFVTKCEQHENGILLSYRIIDGDKIRWTRIILAVPEDYSRDNPNVLLFQRDLAQLESELQDAYRVIEHRYVKIMKGNLKTNSFLVLKQRKEEENMKNKFPVSKYQDNERMEEEELVYPEDLEEFRKAINFREVISFFQFGETEKSIYYRRRFGTMYRWVKMVIRKASVYTDDNPVFLYFIIDVHRTMNDFFGRLGLEEMKKKYQSQSEGVDNYYKNILHILTYFTQKYIQFYFVDLEKDLCIRYKIDRQVVRGNETYVGSYSELAAAYLEKLDSEEDRTILTHYDTPEKLRSALSDKMSIEFHYRNEKGKSVTTICTKVESYKGVPTKVICRTIDKKRDNRLRVRTFGSFEVFDEKGKAIRFSKKKSKQLLAYLIDKYGYPVTTSDIVVDVLEKLPDDLNAKKYVSTVARIAIQDLERAGYTDIIIKEWNSMRINVDSIDCDYYHLLEGDNSYWMQYHNEYMKEYSWAEETNAEILSYGSL